jgi:hypothetical protein
MPKSGSSNSKSGIYRGDCSCRKEIALRNRETFPPCPSCNKAVNWTLVRPTK